MPRLLRAFAWIRLPWLPSPAGATRGVLDRRRDIPFILLLHATLLRGHRLALEVSRLPGEGERLLVVALRLLRAAQPVEQRSGAVQGVDLPGARRGSGLGAPQRGRGQVVLRRRLGAAGEGSPIKAQQEVGFGLAASLLQPANRGNARSSAATRRSSERSSPPVSLRQSQTALHGLGAEGVLASRDPRGPSTRKRYCPRGNCGFSVRTSIRYSPEPPRQPPLDPPPPKCRRPARPRR